MPHCCCRPGAGAGLSWLEEVRSVTLSVRSREVSMSVAEEMIE